MTLYGFFGHHGAGKDTAAKMIPDCKILKFAAPVKRLAAEFLKIYGIEGEDKEALLRVTSGRCSTIRHVQQAICGAGMGISHDIWIRALEPELSRRMAADAQRNIAITDCRFRLSYDFIRERKGVAVLVVRPGCEGDGHPSDELAALPSEFDYVLANTRDHFHLQAQVNWMVDSVGRAG